jgi:hypothetical protein
MDYNQQQEENENGLVFDIGSLYEYLGRVEDTRKSKGKRYTLISLLILMLLAKLGGEDKPSGIAEWIAHRIELWAQYKIVAEPKAASHMTYRRILQEIITPEEFEELVQAFHLQRLKMAFAYLRRIRKGRDTHNRTYFSCSITKSRLIFRVSHRFCSKNRKMFSLAGIGGDHVSPVLSR